MNKEIFNGLLQKVKECNDLGYFSEASNTLSNIRQIIDDAKEKQYKELYDAVKMNASAGEDFGPSVLTSEVLAKQVNFVINKAKQQVYNKAVKEVEHLKAKTNQESTPEKTEAAPPTPPYSGKDSTTNVSGLLHLIESDLNNGLYNFALVDVTKLFTYIKNMKDGLGPIVEAADNSSEAFENVGFPISNGIIEPQFKFKPGDLVYCISYKEESCTVLFTGKIGNRNCYDLDRESNPVYETDLIAQKFHIGDKVDCNGYKYKVSSVNYDDDNNTLFYTLKQTKPEKACYASQPIVVEKFIKKWSERNNVSVVYRDEPLL